MGIRPVVLLVPSMAAAVELPRRLAAAGRAVAGLYPFKVMDLARAVAEPALLGRGLQAWGPGHDALLAKRLLDEGEGPRGLRLAPEVPRAPVAAALARTLSALRRAGIEPARMEAMAERAAATPDDADRLRAVAALYRSFHEAIEGRFADSATVLRAAREHLGTARWLKDAEVLVVDDLELDGLEASFVEALARARPVRLLGHEGPAALAAGSFTAWADAKGIRTAAISDTVLAPLASAAPLPAGLARLRTRLFEPPAGEPARDGSVELVTAPGEAAEVRAIARRLLRAAADGVPFEEMGVVLPRADPYAPLFTDLLRRLGVPHRLHPSLPLRTGRTARALLLLFRCRGLARAAVLEFLTFAPIPFDELLAAGEEPRTAQWDAISRDAGIVSGLDRWTVGIRTYAAAERAAAAGEQEPERRARAQRRAGDAETLLRLVERLAETHETLAGEATWGVWADRLQAAFDRWIGKGRDRDAVAAVIADLRGLAFLERDAPWRDVEAVIEARFEWERVPLEPLVTGAIHVGAMDALEGLPFRLVAIPGLVEGGYPGVVRPDPFLLDPEREALAEAVAAPAPPSVRPTTKGQLSLFDPEPETPPLPSPVEGPGPPTAQDRLLEARRAFHRAVSQATERLILSYPRADPRTGRERMPSLFFVAAASAREGRPVGASDLERIVAEDDLGALSVEDAVDRSERDRSRVRAGGKPAALAVAAGSSFFRQSHLASRARWSKQLTPYDGLVAFSPRDGVSAEVAAQVRRRLDPVTADRPISASRLAAFSRCGFLYLLQYVLRLEPAWEPEERKRLDPLERGSVFHEVAERFLRERRDKGELPLRDTAETRRRLLEVADATLDALVAGSPPRYTVLWERERARFHAGVLKWMEREAAAAGDAVPAWFEVGFGLGRDNAPGEPHRREPLEIDLGQGRTLRVSGKIDRIDRRPDGTLVLRDYKTGKAPKDENGLFRGAKQLQIPFYILAAGEMFPGHRVVEAFLDYVDGGRQVALDPASVQGEEFGLLLRGLVEAIADGVFVQEPSACTWCDYTAACGPAPLIELRRQYKIGDARVQRVLKLRDIG